MSKPGGCHSSGISLGDVLRLPKRHPAWRPQVNMEASSQKGIEPGQGGGRLMGLDGQPSPPIPGRPIVRKPRPSPAAGFSFWVRSQNRAGGSGAYGRSPTVATYASSAEPREGAGQLVCALTLGGAVSYGEATVAPPRSPRRDTQNFRGRWRKNA
jgi:hypothetical protein